MSGGPATVRSVASKASATRSKSKSSLSTVGRAGQSSAVPAKSVNGWLSVFPATVEFNGIAAGSVYALNIRIMNTSKSSLRVRVQPPKQPSFRVNFPKGTGVAPGLELLAEVQFVCDVAQEVHDVLTIQCEGDRVDIPLAAFLPAPNITFDSLVNLGKVVLEGSASAIVELANEGWREARWSVDFGDDSPVSASPSSGVLAPKGKFVDNDGDGMMEADRGEYVVGAAGEWTCKVRITFSGDTLGDFRGLGKVLVEGYGAKTIDVSATVVEQRLSLLLPEGGGPLTQAHFGALYFGEKREIKALLVNSGPVPCAFNAALADRFDVNASTGAVVGYINGSTETVIPGKTVPPADQYPVTIFPAEGVVRPYSQQEITLLFKPIDKEKPPAFKSQYLSRPGTASSVAPLGTGTVPASVRFDTSGSDSALSTLSTTSVKPQPFGPRTLSFDFQAVVVCPETRQAMITNITGSACKAVVEVSLKSLKFGDCSAGDHRDVIINVKNPGATLPMDFALSKTAGFRSTPMKARLQPLQSINVVISFIPGQLGAYNSTIFLAVGDGLAIVPLRAYGRCTRHDKEGKEGEEGDGAVQAQSNEASAASLFKPTLKFVPQPDVPLKTDADLARVTTMLETAGFPGSVVVDPSLSGSVSAGAGSAAWERPKPWEEFLSQEGVDAATVPTALTYTHSIKDMQRVHAHKQGYTQFVRKMRQDREDADAKAKEDKAAMPWHDPVSLGLNPKATLDEPELPIPPAREELWLERPYDADGKLKVGKHGKQHVHDQNKLIAKKYKAQPTTQAELRDCQAELSVEQLQLVPGGPKSIDFGEISVGSTSKKSFTVANNLEQSVLVAVKAPDGSKELSSSPSTQVIPSGGVAGFDIQMTSSEVQDFSEKMEYVINGHHSYLFTVNAAVRPINVEIVPSALEFDFPEDSTDTELTKSVQIVNHSDAPAPYSWTTVDGSYVVNPSSGTIPPNGSVTASVTYRASSKPTASVSLVLSVVGGDELRSPPTLLCTSTVEEPKVSFPQKKIEFGPIGVATDAEFIATLKNIGECPAVFWITPPMAGVTVVPERGRILAGDSLDLSVTLRAIQPQVYDEKRCGVVVNLRGAKPMTLPFSAQAVLPDVSIVEPEFTFGVVTVGGALRLPASFQNVGVIPAELHIDLTKYPQFTLEASDELGASDSVAGGGAGAAAPSSDDCALIPEEVGNASGDDDPFSPESLAAAVGKPKELDAEAEREQLRLFTPHRFTLRIPAGETLFTNIVFQPTTARSHKFTLPVILPGVSIPEGLVRTITGEGVEPRLRTSLSDNCIDFQFKVVPKSSAVKRVPYKMAFTLTNVDSKAIPWTVDTAGLTGEAAVFKWVPAAGTLEPSASVSIEVTFLPEEAKEYKVSSLPLFIDGVTTRPYLSFDIVGTGIFPQLTFDCREVILPAVPLGVQSRVLFHIINSGYDYLELRHRLPVDAGPSQVPLKLYFPEGPITSLAKQVLPVEVQFMSKRPVAFSANIEFLDDSGGSFIMPVSGVTDNSLLTVYPFIEGNRSQYVISATAKTAPTLTIRPLKLSSSPVSGNTTNRSRLTGTGVPSAAASPAPVPVPAPVEEWSPMPSLPLISDASLQFLVKWMNANLFKSPVESFPRDVISSHGRPLYDVIELLCGRGMPGKINTRLPQGHVKRIQAVYNEARDCLNFLKGYGAFLHHIRPEQLLSREAYVTVKMAGRSSQFSPPFGAPVLELKSAAAIQSRRREFIRKYPIIAREAWLNVALQVVKLFTLTRVSMKALSVLPGMEPPPEVSLPVVVDDSKPKTKKEEPTEHELATLAKLKAKQLSPDSLLTGSNFMSISECLLLRWLSYHHNKVTVGPARRLIDFDRDLRDGAVLAGVILSHCPHLGAPGKPLETVIWVPKTEAEYVSNAKAVCKALQLLQLDFPLNPDTIVQSGPGVSDGVGLEPKPSVSGRASPTKDTDAAGAGKLGLYDTGGLLANATGTNVEIGDGLQRENMLAVLFLFQHLPQQVPRTEIEFKGALGQTLTKAIELKNPAKRAITYHVTMEGANEFSVQESTFRLEPESTGAFVVTCTTRFSTPVTGRLTFRSRREGGLSAAVLVFLLKSNVSSRPPVESVPCQTGMYTPVLVDVEVQNPFGSDGNFKMSILQDGSAVPASEPVRPASRGASRSGGRRPPKGNTTKKVVAPPPAPEEPYPDAFWSKSTEVAIRAGKRKKVQIQFLPFREGAHVCQLVFLDPERGEFVYEVRGEATLPVPSQPLRFISDMKPAVMKDLKMPANNSLFATAQNAALDRLDRKSKAQALRVRDAAAKEAAIAKAKVVASGADVSSWGITYDVELSSPFFEAPKQVFIRDPDLDASPDLMQSPARPASEAFSASPLKRDPDGGAGAPVSVAVDGQLVTPRGGDPSGLLPLVLRPKAPGMYLCKAVLRSGKDTRVYHIEATVLEEGINKSLEFVSPARQSVTQDIPIVNNSDFEWALSANLTGSEYFKGNRMINVPAHGVATYSVTFRPDWVCDATAELVLENSSSKSGGQVFVPMHFTFRGIGQEPLAEEHLSITCAAREKVVRTFAVKNPTRKPVTFTVESDMPHISGAGSFTVDGLPREAEADYELTFTPLLGGTYSGTLHFIDPSDGRFQWYTIEMNVSPPPPEDKLEVEATVRQAVSLEISLSNPLQQAVTFEVTLEGDGLIGTPFFELGPGASGMYDVLFSPITPGKQEGSISFVNDKCGEFWYKLDLTALPAPPVALPHMTAPVGYKVSHVITLENPINEEVYVKSIVTNRTNFIVDPPTFNIPKYSSANVTIIYQPSSIGEEESGKVRFVSPQLGEWVYTTSGSGLKPGLHPEDIVVTSTAGGSSSSSISFRNPFNDTIEVVLELVSAAIGGKTGKAPGIGGSPFTLLKKPRTVLPAMGAVQIPFSFSPLEIAEARATLTVHCGPRDLTWTYNIRGIAEAPLSEEVIDISCKARSSKTVPLSFVLPNLRLSGVPDEHFTHELIIPDNKVSYIRRSLQVECVTTEGKLAGVDDPLEFDVTLEPLKPFEASIQLVVNKSTGGRWRYLMRVTALEPTPDDVIDIEATLHKTSSVSFGIANHFPQYAPFKAYFSMETPPEFFVYPTEGVLPPNGSAPTNFVISFTPREYGKASAGKLFIESEDMVWSYVVRGAPPEYVTPQGMSKIDSKMDPAIVSKMTAAAAESRARNIMRENMVMPSKGKGTSSTPSLRGPASVASSARK